MPRRVVPKIVKVPRRPHFFVLDIATSVVLLGEKHQPQTLCDLQKAGNVEWIEAPLLMRCSTQHNSYLVVETEARKLNIFVYNVSSIVHFHSLFGAVVKSIANFSAAFENEHGVYFLDAQMVDIVGNKVSSDLCSEIARRHISTVSG